MISKYMGKCCPFLKGQHILGYSKKFKLRLLISYQYDSKRVYKKKIFIFSPAQKDKTGKLIPTTFNIRDNRHNKKIVSGMTLNQAVDYINKVRDQNSSIN